jgi:MazG family protein
MDEAPKNLFDAPPPGAPNLNAVSQAFKELCTTIAWLRDPVHGCPWDLQQTHASLRRFMLEEAYEAVEVMGNEHPNQLAEELGDVLLQVVLNAQVALDQGTFSLEDVIRHITQKMRRRHPHVFLKDQDPQTSGEESQLRKRWEEIKAIEKTEKGESLPNSDFFHKTKSIHPATTQALKIGELSATIKFDWNSPQEVLQQVRSELLEVEEEFLKKEYDLKLIAEEIGDLYFSLTQLCRHLGLDPEVTSFGANLKFLKRFASVEKLAAEKGLSVTTAERSVLEALWCQAKELEKKHPLTN